MDLSRFVSVVTSMSLVPILSQMHPVRNIPSYNFKIHFRIIFPFMPSLLSGAFLPDFLAKILYLLHFNPMRATCLSITLSFTWSLWWWWWWWWGGGGKEYKSSPYILHPPVIYFLLGPNILFSTLFWITLFLMCKSYLCMISDSRETGKDSKLNGSKHSPYLICSWFLCEWNFDLVVRTLFGAHYRNWK
jgi:hypothetical protein